MGEKINLMKKNDDFGHLFVSVFHSANADDIQRSYLIEMESADTLDDAVEDMAGDVLLPVAMKYYSEDERLDEIVMDSLCDSLYQYIDGNSKGCVLVLQSLMDTLDMEKEFA